MSGNKTIVYEEFLECQNYTFDIFWREIFYSCACNKFPKGSKYDKAKNTLYIRYDKSGKSKTESFQLPIHPSEKYNLLIGIFKEFLNLKSDYDIDINKKELEEFRLLNQINLDTEWKKIKPRSVRNNIIMKFATTQININNLKSSKIKKLYNLIQLGFQFKQITNEDVIYENGVIESITGLDFDTESKKFVFKNKPKFVARVEKHVVKNNQINQCIDKWAKEYKVNNLI